jgi:polyhydroxybutyrate depolymerase
MKSRLSVFAVSTVVLVSAAFFLVRIVRAQNTNTGADPEQTLSVDSVDRTFYVHLPKGYDAKQKYPVVMVLHTMDEEGDDIARISHFDEVADRYGVIAIYPNAVQHQWNVGVAAKPQSSGYNSSPRGFGGMGGGGHRGMGRPPVQTSSPSRGPQANDLEFFDHMLDKLAAEYSVDPARIYATGLSDGGFMDFRLACGMSDRIAAIAPVGATLPKELSEHCLPTRPVPLLMVDGTADPLVPYKGGTAGTEKFSTMSAEDSAKSWSKLDNCAQKPKKSAVPPVTSGGKETRVDAYDDCQQGAAVELYSVEGGGATWPGSVEYMPESRFGKTSSDLNANDVIWKFFAAHTLPARQAAAQ